MSSEEEEQTGHGCGAGESSTVKTEVKMGENSKELLEQHDDEESGPPDVETIRRELTMEQAATELLECCRFGEIDNVRLICEAFPELKIDEIDDGNGTTALHMACANGHAALVLWLLMKGATLRKNDSGNSPLHWALLNKRENVVKMLVAKAKNLDVFDRNGFNKTCVTMAYDTNNTEILKAILEHSSAARLNKDGSVAEQGKKSDLEKEEAEDEQGEDSAPRMKQQTMVSHLSLGGERPGIPIREIGFVENPLEKKTDLETTGAFMWAAALILARWIVDMKQAFVDKHVIELGAGCSVPGIVAAQCTGAKEVLVSDIDSPTFENTRYNVMELNPNPKLSAQVLDWSNKDTWPSNLSSFDVIIGSDLVYDHDLVEPLAQVITNANPNVVFYYVTADTDRAGFVEFKAVLQKLGMKVDVKDAPAEYLMDPFQEKDPDSFALRFPEFDNTTFKLYRFYR